MYEDSPHRYTTIGSYSSSYIYTVAHSLLLEIFELRVKVDLLESKVLALESNTSNKSAVPSTQISDVLQEFTERDRCKLNIIMYGLPESTSSDLPTKINDDKIIVRDIFSKLSADIHADFKPFRLGKPTSTSCRPLKVIFGFCEAASAVLLSYRQAKIHKLSLLPLTSIVRDKTLLERLQLRTCHLELDRRVAAGEQNLTITFKNCSPVYIPPSSPIELYTTHLNTIDFIVQKYLNHSFILTGDYNLPFISWSNDTHGLCFLTQTISDFTSIPERLAIHGFFQHNYILNSHHSLLDLIFSNLSSITVNQALDTAVPADTYHPPLSLFINLPTHALQSTPLKSFYNFNKADYTQINKFLNYFNWKRTFLSYSLDDSMSVFLDALHYSILSSVPKISFRPSTFPSWYTKELKELVFAKSRAYGKFKSSQLLSDYNHFSLLRTKFKFISKQCYRNFVSRTESSLLHNPQYFWSSIKKTALLYLYLQVLHYMVYRVHHIPI
ncbi:hypothetical protein QTP88_012158 [Uroleucon formosanum]